MLDRHTVLATPETSLSSPYVGLFRPVFVVQGDHHVLPADPNDYPNRGLVFVPSRYVEMTQNLPPGGLLLMNVEQNRTATISPDDPNYAEYIVTKDSWREPPRWLIHRIVYDEFNPAHRTIAMPNPPRHPVWLLDSKRDRAYGPFDTTSRALASGEVSVTLKPPASIPFLQDPPGHAIMRIPARLLQLVDTDTATYGALDPATLTPDVIEWVDFITDESLMNWTRDLLRAETVHLTKRDVDAIKTLLSDSADVTTDPFFQGRAQRATALLDQISDFQERRAALISDFLDSDRGQPHVDRYLDTHRDTLIDDAYARHHELIQQRVTQHTTELARLAADIDAKQQELEDLQSIDTDAIRAKRQELEAALQDKQQELEAIRAQLDVAEDVADLRDLHDNLQADVDALNTTKQALQTENDELLAVRERLADEASADLAKMRERLAGLKPYVDTLTGTVSPIRESPALTPIRIARTQPDTLPDLVDRAHQALRDAHHYVPRIQLANVLTGVLTSPLTILTGLPGVGKTSLATRLAAALGLTPTSQFLTIRVPRGWRSRTDTLGYHNPITGQYEEAPTGLYRFLKLHAQRQQEPVPAWVLFDEANLSPPEHWFSDVLPMLDEGADRSLVTGLPGEILTVPEHIRFLFTTNQDHSVEPLTPRVLDRAAVVHLSPPDAFDTNTGAQRIAPMDGTISMDALTTALQAVPTTLTSSEDSTFAAIARTLQDDDPNLGVPTYLSPRKRQRVHRHTTTLRTVLGANAGLDALDYAVATHVLPLIRGSGAGYRKRLTALKAQLEGLPNSSALLNRILAAGDSNFEEFAFQSVA